MTQNLFMQKNILEKSQSDIVTETPLYEGQVNYSIISASVPNYPNDTNLVFNGKPENTGRSWGYVFQTPNTARAWKRLNYTTVVLITIDYENFNNGSRHLLNIVPKELEKVNVIPIYFNVPSTLKVRLAQLLRLIPAHLKLFDDNAFLTTSDADVWPVNSRRYHIPPNKDIHITNSDCCSFFLRKGQSVKMFPITTITMKVKTWKKVFKVQNLVKSIPRNYHNYKPLTYNYHHVKNFLEDLRNYTDGKNIYKPSLHNDNLWYLDQKYASILIKKFADQYGWNRLSFYPKFRCPRIDTKGLQYLNSVSPSCIDDIHVPKWHPWFPKIWNKMAPVLDRLYEQNTKAFMNQYARLFSTTYNTLHEKILN